MRPSDNHPLAPLAEDAYQRLLDSIDPSAGISIDEAHERLCEDDFSMEEAEYAVEQLLNRGYLYAVEDTLFVTEAEDTSA
jgi:hypothetical protein